ncbi:hypothetical protein PERCYII29_0758 [Pseudomonas aeruginosa]|nr:hypothetical protein PERCYII29_0758 [Pseudomonas aeruginosa]
MQAKREADSWAEDDPGNLYGIYTISLWFNFHIFFIVAINRPNPRSASPGPWKLFTICRARETSRFRRSLSARGRS